MVVQLRTPTKSFSARRAFEAFKKLQALTEDEGARKELAAAGVSNHRIEALYPGGFAARIPTICQHLGRAGEDEVFNVKEAVTLISAHAGLFPEAVSKEIDHLGKVLYSSPEFLRLREAINERFPLAESQRSVANESSLPIVAAYTFWMMERRGKLGREETLQGVYELFYQTYAYLIPELAT